MIPILIGVIVLYAVLRIWAGREANKRYQLKCFRCQAPVSSPLPAGTVVRGLTWCPDCVPHIGAAARSERSSVEQHERQAVV